MESPLVELDARDTRVGYPDFVRLRRQRVFSKIIGRKPCPESL